MFHIKAAIEQKPLVHFMGCSFTALTLNFIQITINRLGENFYIVNFLHSLFCPLITTAIVTTTPVLINTLLIIIASYFGLNYLSNDMQFYGFTSKLSAIMELPKL